MSDLVDDEDRRLCIVGIGASAGGLEAIREMLSQIDLEAEAARLNKVMDEVGNVTIFLSEGAGLDAIIEEMEKDGQEVPRDPFGHVKLDAHCYAIIYLDLADRVAAIQNIARDDFRTLSGCFDSVCLA